MNKNMQDNLEDQIRTMVLTAVRQGLEFANRDVERLSASSSLTGEHAIIDSVSLVTIIVELEENIEEAFGASIMIFDGDDIVGGGPTDDNSPFRSIDILATHICSLLAQ